MVEAESTRGLPESLDLYGLAPDCVLASDMKLGSAPFAPHVL